MPLIIKHHALDIARIAVLTVLSMLFSLSLLPLPVLYAGLTFGLFGLAWQGVVNLVGARRVGTDIYITIAVIVAVLGKEYLAAAIVLLIILIAEFIGDVISERARNSIRSLVDAMPKDALVRRSDGTEETIAVDQLVIGDLVIVRNGEKIPVDGLVLHGSGAVNQAAITGENMPQEIDEGMEVYASTVLESGALDIRVTTLHADTLFAHIINLVEEAQEQRAPIEKLADRIAAYLVPVSFAFVLAVYLYTGDVRTIVALLIFTSPAELALATPLVMVAGIARAAREGVLVKGGAFLEEMARIDTFVFDKTGTLTVGKPAVTDVDVLDASYSKAQVIRLAAAADRRSSHPLAKAIVQHAEQMQLEISQPTSFETIKGRGISAVVDGRQVYLGNAALLADQQIDVPSAEVKSPHSTVLYLGVGGKAIAILRVTDTLRTDARETLQALKASGVTATIMLTGDNAITAAAIAEQVGITNFRAGLLPGDKIRIVRELQDGGRVKVAMVGDGVNDAPALAQADVGIAMGSMGNQAAMDAADIVLIGDDLRKVARMRSLSKRAYRTIKENIVVGVGVVHVVGIVLVLTGAIGPIQAAAMHLVPDVLVFLNSTKLLKVKI
jgi:Cd2+/Zn2+-exporting ATPase